MTSRDLVAAAGPAARPPEEPQQGGELQQVGADRAHLLPGAAAAAGRGATAQQVASCCEVSFASKAALRNI